MSNIQPTKTLIYKTVDNLPISLDLYLPPPTSTPIPILLWFHGGGLLQGHRNQLPPHFRRSVSARSLALISADYRLAPQSPVSQIHSDVLDCITFIRTALQSHSPEQPLDVSRLAVSGSSAGGYLSLLAGLYAEPKPKVILPIYPITDPFGTFFTNPQPAPMGRNLVSREELSEELDFGGKVVANSGPAGEDVRGNMYVRMLADASLSELWGLGKEPSREGERWRLARGVYGRGLPPAYFLFGDGDTCVGVEQGDEVVGAMVGCGIEVKYERVHGEDHFLDCGEGYENEEFYGFLMKHV